MNIGIVCCRSLEKEIQKIAKNIDRITRIDVMEWELHIEPERLLAAVTDKIHAFQKEVDAVVLGYGRCQAMDRLPSDFRIPVFRPDAEDCIGVVLGQNRYEEELKKEAGTWFFTPGWTELGMEFIFGQLQINQITDKLSRKGKKPMDLAHQMLKDYTRGLYIDTGIENQNSIIAQARDISHRLHLRFDQTTGSTRLLEDTVARALSNCRR